MPSEQNEWLQWPPNGRSSFVVGKKPAKPADPPPTDISGLVDSAVKVASSWVPDIPPSLSKVAALQEDTGKKAVQMTERNIWRHPHAHPFVLLMMILDEYGQESLEWEPSVLKTTLSRDERTPSSGNWTKIQAVRVLLKSPSPWREWESFHWVALGLSGQQPNFTFYEMAEIGHLVSLADLMSIVDPERVTSEEVDMFVAAVFKDKNIPFIPQPLSFAQDELEDPTITCKGCGAIHRDDNDIRCVTCGSADLEKVPFELQTERDGVAALWGSRNKKVLELSARGLPESMEGTATYHLLVHWDYAKQQRLRMIQQLRMTSK